MAKIGEAKKHSLSIKANDIFITPFTRDKKATVFYKNLDTSCKKKLLHHIPIYTSTSFRKMSNTSNRTPFIAIKNKQILPNQIQSKQHIYTIIK